MSKKIKLFICAVSVVTTFSFVGCIPDNSKAVAPPLIKSSPIKAKTVKVTKGTIEKDVSFTGFVVPQKSEVINFNSSGGVVTKINFTIGDKVKKGQVLAELDTEEVKVAVKQVQLKYEKLNNSYKTVCADPEAPQTQKDGLKLDLDLQSMQLEKVKKQLDSLTLLSPCDGQVTFKYSKLAIGESISASDPICIISDTNNVLVDAKIDDATGVKVGMKATGSSGESGKISSITLNPFKEMLEQNVDSGNKSPTAVKLKMDNLAGKKLGSSISLRVVLDNKDNVLKIPRSSVKYFNGSPYVRIVKDENKIEKFITLGIESSQEYEVIDGLAEGDEILSN